MLLQIQLTFHHSRFHFCFVEWDCLSRELMQRLMVEYRTDGSQNTSDLVSRVTAAIQGADSMVMSNVVRLVLSLDSSLGVLLTSCSPLQAPQTLP
jgi:hypothetical protein